MIVTKTYLEGCFVTEPQIFGDERGYFFESFNKEKLQKLTNLEIVFSKDNVVFSKR
jgi:dTDP-4-dehydrorhamnose 3,5-epimerase